MKLPVLYARFVSVHEASDDIPGNIANPNLMNIKTMTVVTQAPFSPIVSIMGKGMNGSFKVPLELTQVLLGLTSVV